MKNFQKYFQGCSFTPTFPYWVKCICLFQVRNPIHHSLSENRLNGRSAVHHVRLRVSRERLSQRKDRLHFLSGQYSLLDAFSLSKAHLSRSGSQLFRLRQATRVQVGLDLGLSSEEGRRLHHVPLLSLSIISSAFRILSSSRRPMRSGWETGTTRCWPTRTSRGS